MGSGPEPPAYRRVTLDEVMQFRRLRRRGRSARWIARRFRRSHHTVTRWLIPLRGYLTENDKCPVDQYADK